MRMNLDTSYRSKAWSNDLKAVFWWAWGAGFMSAVVVLTLTAYWFWRAQW